MHQHFGNESSQQTSTSTAWGAASPSEIAMAQGWVGNDTLGTQATMEQTAYDNAASSGRFSRSGKNSARQSPGSARAQDSRGRQRSSGSARGVAQGGVPTSPRSGKS